MRALVIDDSRAMRRIVTGILTRLGYEVRDAGHGREGLDVLDEGWIPDLCCVDWNMPVMDGLQFVSAVRSNPAWRSVTITATDLSREMVERTRTGRFSQLEVNRGLPAPMLVRHFTRVGAEWEVAPGLRRMVTASECNLAAPLPRMGPFDVVYLRNVLIYFDLSTKQSILRRVRELMRPDGWLFLGAAETTLGVDDSWERVVIGRSSAYRPLKGA